MAENMVENMVENMAEHRFTIVGIGEALFDVFPGEQRLGGAPLNVAVHAHQLAQPHGGRGVVVSRVGQDQLGQSLQHQLAQRGMSCDFVETDPDRPTGRVYVDVDPQGQPTYDIVRDVAWDVLQFDPDLEDLAHRCEAVCFGSLAQRNAQTRNSIYRFLDAAAQAICMFDVNLRQDYFDQRIIRRSCEMAGVVKLNNEELPIVADLCGLGGTGSGHMDEHDRKAQALLKQFELQMLVLTRGQRGTRIFTADGCHDGQATSYPPTADADSVGAGDACAAAILVGHILHLPMAQLADLANHAGAFVASQPGATPALPPAILQMTKC